jgi:DNA-binding PadR family transcriptional regulator
MKQEAECRKGPGIHGIGGLSLNKDIARGIAKLIILGYIKKTKTYPYELLKHIKEHNLYLARLLTKSDIYNMTASLEKGGFIKSRVKVANNKVQKMYVITDKGEQIIAQKDALISNTLREFKQLIKEGLND